MRFYITDSDIIDLGRILSFNFNLLHSVLSFNLPFMGAAVDVTNKGGLSRDLSKDTSGCVLLGITGFQEICSVDLVSGRSKMRTRAP